MKIPLLERAFKYCSSSLVKFTQEMLWRMLLKRKVCSQLRLQKAVGAGKHLTAKFNAFKICQTNVKKKLGIFFLKNKGH